MKQLLGSVLLALPEPVKQVLRRSLLKVRTGMPRELMVSRGETVLQVGMWRPRQAVRLFRAVGPTGKLVFVEMSEKALNDVRTALESEGCTNATFVNKGAWHQAGVVDMLDSDDSSAVRIDTDRHHPRESYAEPVRRSVPVERLDTICADLALDHVDYAEITVNGAELQALDGLTAFLPNVRRLWVAGLTRNEDGTALNSEIAAFLEGQKFETAISRTGRVVSSDWGRLDGHVYAWQ